MTILNCLALAFGSVFRSALFAFPTAADQARSFGVALAASAMLFALHQYCVQRPRAKRPEAYFPRTDEKHFQFCKRQAFRRMQLSILVGLTGAFMFVGCFIDQPTAWAVAWIGAIFFGGWTLALACVDAISIRIRFEDELSRNHSEKILLQYQLSKLRDGVEKKDESTDDAQNASDATNDAKSNERPAKGDKTDG